jgi:hypothetical protein
MFSIVFYSELLPLKVCPKETIRNAPKHDAQSCSEQSIEGKMERN